MLQIIRPRAGTVARAGLLAILMFASMAPAGGLTRAALDGIAVETPAQAQVPLALSFSDDNGRPLTLADALAGRPAVLVFADYTCRTLCGPILDFVAAGLEQSGLMPGRDFRLIVIGLDPKDAIDSARAMKAAHVGATLAGASVFLTGSQAAIDGAAAAVGYRYAYDADHDQFAHPAAAFVLDSSGRVARVLSALGLSGADLRLALVDAGEGRVGSLSDHLRLLCYGYDAVHGRYTETVTRSLAIAAAATVLALAAGIALLSAKSGRRTAS